MVKKHVAMFTSLVNTRLYEANPSVKEKRMKTAKYKNPWHSPKERSSKFENAPFYETNVKPTEYRGFKIYHRHTEVWDVVRDGVCVSQRAGFNGAKRFIDQIHENKDNYFVQRSLSYLPAKSVAALAKAGAA